MELLLFSVIILFLFFSLIALFVKQKKDKRKYRKMPYFSQNENNQLSLISEAEFNKKTLMNKSEYQLFLKLTNLLNALENKIYFRLFSQVSMGEFLATKEDHHFSLINSKRVDFLIIDRKGYPVIAVEYQGTGHFQKNAVERDAIKREACRKAKIKYIEFEENNQQIQLDTITKYLNQYLEENNAKPNPNQLAKNR
ncbi:hypothetical protein BKG92_08905 [Rodentibacter ratti]|uniref:DUF2726 domain-containing protein n=1 Tax=Rodentibacter ratti TaxID=1906745 RepID=A0A1V3KVY3_9PAST|nr:DUF2726 domain-containing protein [Rodentibacter ratti]OOF81458.1 hypothetical protein BKG92_08905 [Rodentibacter ratti]